MAIGLWLLGLTAFFYASGQGGAWARLLPVVAVLHFGLAYRQLQIARKDSNRGIGLQ